MDYRKRLLSLLSDSSPIQWDKILDVYNKPPRDFFTAMLSEKDPDAQDGLCQEFFAGMFHQEMAEPSLPQMMEPLLLACALDNTAESTKANLCGTLSYITEQGWAVEGYIGHMPLRMGFYEADKPSLEMQCIYELRKHKDILAALGTDGLMLWFSIAEVADGPALTELTLRSITQEDCDQTLFNCGMQDFFYGNGIVQAVLEGTQHRFNYDPDYLAVSKRLGGLSLNSQEQEAFSKLLITAMHIEKIWLANFAILALYKESGFDWHSIAPSILAQKEAYAPIAEQGKIINSRYMEHMLEARRADAEATRGLTGAEYTKALQERHKLYNIWEEEKKKHAELEAIGYSEWPTFQVVSEYIVMDMFRENLGTGIKLESFTPKQQKLLDFLRENEIDTYMERFAGIKTDQSF